MLQVKGQTGLKCASVTGPGMEGNITNHLGQGMAKGIIGLIQMREGPGRLEPGTGEMDCAV